MKALGLYIHIPFCRSKCLYCDFCSVPTRDSEKMIGYTHRLCADLSSRAALCKEYEVDTVYLGGGTPTVLPLACLEEILKTVYRSYRVTENAEITIECNPASGAQDAAFFEALHRFGFNRLSIGLQSVHQKELKALGRIHSFADFQSTMESARQGGFANISADLMFGIPHQTLASYSESIRSLCALRPTHISAYSLIVEDGTPFGRQRAHLPLPDEDLCAEMFEAGIALLDKLGYKQYEISNFALAGYESRHNLKYWNCDPFLGFGPGAYSDFSGARFGNSRSLDAYIEGEDIEAEREFPSPAQRMNEYLMLQMRLSEGVKKDAFLKRFSEKDYEAFCRAATPYEKGGFIRQTHTGRCFTPKGFAVSNTILSDILDFSE